MSSMRCIFMGVWMLCSVSACASENVVDGEMQVVDGEMEVADDEMMMDGVDDEMDVADDEVDVVADEAEGVDVMLTYHRDLRPVVTKNCIVCHNSQGIAPFALEEYQDLIDNIFFVIPAVEAGVMPPWPADDTCHPITDSRSLDTETRSLFRLWRDQGMLEGDPGDYVMPEEPPKRSPLGDITSTIEMDTSYVAQRRTPGQEDEHRCFLLPVGIEQETYMRALQVIPSSRAVHHLQVHRIPMESVAEAEARDAGSPGPGYPCFGDSASGSYNLFSWHPGAEIIQFDDDTAAYLSAGSRLALQIHFNLDGFASDEEIPAERTRVNLWLLPEGEVPEYVVVRFFLSGGPINLPPGEPLVVIEQATRMGDIGVEGGSFAPGEFIGHTPHMHWLGQEFLAWLQPVGGEPACLVDVPKWNFDWQLDYWYPRERYIPFGADDVVTVRCGYDNSVENQPIVDGAQQAPQRVTFGQSSTDEMCLNHTWVRYDREAYLASRPGR